jgi:hypothetical protein
VDIVEQVSGRARNPSSPGPRQYIQLRKNIRPELLDGDGLDQKQGHPRDLLAGKVYAAWNTHAQTLHCVIPVSLLSPLFSE